MSASQESQPTLDSIAPRFGVGDMEQALAFYGQLGFATTYHDEGFAIVERDGIALHFNVSDGPPTGRSVCWIGVTNIEALYQQYLPTGAIQSPLQIEEFKHAKPGGKYLPTGAIQSPLQVQPWGMKGFFLCDPFRNLLLFGERIPEGESDTEQGA